MMDVQPPSDFRSRFESVPGLIADRIPALVSYVDSERRYRFANAGYLRWFGHSPEQLIGRHLADVLGEAVYEAVRPRVDAVLAGNETTFEGTLPYKDGGPRFVRVNYVPDFGEGGAVRGYFALVYDLTDRARVEEELRRGRDTFFRLIEDAPFGVYVVDSEFRLRQVSAGARHAFRGVEPLLDRDFAEVLRCVWPEPFASEAIGRFRHTLATGEPYHSADTTEERGGGEVESYDWQVKRVALPDGGFGVVCYFYDMTELRSAERDARFLDGLGERIRSARESGPLLAAAVEAIGRYLKLGRCYFAETDEERDRWWVRDDYHHGLPPLAGEYRVSDYPAFLVTELRAGRTLVSEDNAADPRTAAAFQSAFRPIGIRAHVVVPLVRGGRWYASLVAATAEPRAWQPREVRLLETAAERLWNAAEKLRLDAQLRENERRVRAFADAAPAMLWVTGPGGDCTFLSRGWFAFTGQSEETGLGFGWLDAVHAADRDATREAFLAANARRGPFALEHRLRRADGEYRWVIDAGRPRLGPAGEFFGYVGSVIDIDDRKRAEQALQEADRRKDEFLATLAHELRNPLAPLSNSLNVLRLTGGFGPDGGEIQGMMERQVAHLVRLVDDLLEVSRITRGAIELRLEETDLAAVVRAAVETSRPIIDEARHRLAIDLPTEPLMLRADPVRLTQVFANLLNNAARYTDAGGQIWLTARAEGGEVVASVRDSGIGLAADMLPRLFEMFAQADRSAGRSRGGLGIGLALVRSLVRLHGGRVEAKSDGQGKGSEFTVRLPLSPAASRPPARGEARPLPLTRRQVLIVDDNRDAADSLAKVLSYLGAEVRTAYDGPSALEAASERRPEAVVLDLGMPGMDGLEVARRVRLRPDLRGVTLIALTGWGQADDRRRTKEVGFDHHLVKPVDLEALRAILAGPAS